MIPFHEKRQHHIQDFPYIHFLFVFRNSDGDQVVSIGFNCSSVWSLCAFSGNNKRFALWNVCTGTIDPFDFHAKFMIFSPDHNYVALVGEDIGIRIREGGRENHRKQNLGEQ